MRRRLLFVTAALIILTLPSVGRSATITVTSGSTDELTANSSCSLREAIINTNNDADTYADCAKPASESYGDDVIVIPAGTYLLTLGASGEDNAAQGDLDIADTLTLSGAGADSTIVDAGGLSTGIDSYQDRVLHITSAVAVTIEGIKITGGNVDRFGGGIRIAPGSTLTLTNSAVFENAAASSSSYALGGGIFAHSSATLILTNSIVSGNTAAGTYVYGGGIYASSATLTNSAVSGNMASGSSSDAYGGGIFVASSATILTNSIVSGNTATGSSSNAYGGGIYTALGATLTLTNSTISGNTADGSSYAKGGGLHVVSSATVTHSTIFGNMATGPVQASGGGIFIWGTTVTINLKNTILSGNDVNGSSEGGAECYSAGTWNSYGYNFIATASTSSNCSLIYTTSSADSTTDIIDKTSSELLLDSLAGNGGDTQTHALLAFSPALDAGSCMDISGNTVSTDQRGKTRTSPCDIGAYEAVCGDADIAGNETCDDGGTNSGDGCSAVCTVETDADGDGHYAEVDDCNDINNAIHPGAIETCEDEVDSDCDGANETFTLYVDSDADGYGSTTETIFNCTESSTQTGYASTTTDCNDSSSAVHPGATESCNSIDDDCDGTIDEDVTTTYYADADEDGYGSISSPQTACSQPSGYVTKATDCNDANSSINPAATDTPDNGTDENCNGVDATSATKDDATLPDTGDTGGDTGDGAGSGDEPASGDEPSSTGDDTTEGDEATGGDESSDTGGGGCRLSAGEGNYFSPLILSLSLMGWSILRAFQIRTATNRNS